MYTGLSVSIHTRVKSVSMRSSRPHHTTSDPAAGAASERTFCSLTHSVCASFEERILSIGAPLLEIPQVASPSRKIVLRDIPIVEEFVGFMPLVAANLVGPLQSADFGRRCR